MEASFNQATNIVEAIQPSFTTDLGILFFIVVLLFVVTLWRGTGLAVSLLLALYPTHTLGPRVYELLPDSFKAGSFGMGALTLHALGFLIILLAITFAIYRFVDCVEKPTGLWRYTEAILVACATSGAFFSTAYQVLGTHTLFRHSDFIATWFVGETATIVWLTIPLAVLVLVARK